MNNKIIKYIYELQEFIECDLWTKFKPFEVVNGKTFKRQDSFECEKDFLRYLDSHFNLLINRIKNELKEQGK